MGKFSRNSQDISQEFQLPSAYESAMEALSTLITQKKKRNGTSAISGPNQKLDRMLRYIKGSTCAFSEVILRECGFRTGLFTSPHLIDIRERYRLDGYVFLLLNRASSVSVLLNRWGEGRVPVY